jgi:hypothetical protein
VTGQSWDELAAAVAARIPVLRDGDTLILEHDGRYVQFRQAPDALYAEAVANRYLPPERQVGPDAEADLGQLGWHRPTPPGHHNWWRELPWPARSQEARELADALVATLRRVYAVASPDQLGVEAFNAETGQPWTFGG